MAKPKTKTKARKPLTISIHGDGIDIDAKIDVKPGAPNLDTVIRSLAERMAGQAGPSPTTGPHDFDIVQSVIKHGDTVVLQAIIDLAKGELEQRRATQS